MKTNKTILDACCGGRMFWWNECHIPLKEILALTPERPLFGNRVGKAAKTHWVVFTKV